jgi:hypothetical protein
MIIVSDILKLTKQMLPSGRAWRLPNGGYFEKLFKGLAVSEITAYNFALSTMNRLLADNEGFTAADATEWERRLALPINPGYTSLATRKTLILRKYQFPGGFLNRQNYRYLEYQLKLAGFDVTVTENTDSNLVIGEAFQFSEDTEMGLDTEMGSTTIDIIANSPFYGEAFDVDSPLSVFIITGTVSPNFITAFRQLVLQLKPVTTVAMCVITYSISGDLAFVNGDNAYTVDDRNLVTMDYV